MQEKSTCPTIVNWAWPFSWKMLHSTAFCSTPCLATIVPNGRVWRNFLNVVWKTVLLNRWPPQFSRPTRPQKLSGTWHKENILVKLFFSAQSCKKFQWIWEIIYGKILRLFFIIKKFSDKWWKIWGNFLEQNLCEILLPKFAIIFVENFGKICDHLWQKFA